MSDKETSVWWFRHELDMQLRARLVFDTAIEKGVPEHIAKRVLLRGYMLPSEEYPNVESQYHSLTSL